MGLFSRRRYAEGTVPDHVEELDGSVIGPPPASYPPQPSYPGRREPRYPSSRHAPDSATEQIDEAGEEFYDDEDSEDRPEAGGQERPRFLPPPPTRRAPGTGRGARRALFASAILVALARWIFDALPDHGGGSDGSERWNGVRDVYATVASEPERRLTAQGVEFHLLGNRPLDREVCSFLENCLAGAGAEWDVTGATMTGRSWYLVFEDEEAADAAARSAQLGLALTPGIPSNWAIRAGSPGRFLIIAAVGRADDAAADVRSDPTAVAAADALRIYSTEPAVLEVTNR